MEDSSDWCVECSDDEDKYGSNGRWEPPPDEIVKLYQALANGDELILDWKCPGRRLPQTGKKSKPMNLHENSDSGKNSTSPSDGSNSGAPASPSGYEFDVDDAAGPVTPSRVTRIPGKTPKSAQKRVARFDRVINDINRQKLGSPVASPDSPSSAGTAATTSTAPSSSAPISTSQSTNNFNPPSKPVHQQLQQMKLQSAASGTVTNPTSSPQQTTNATSS